MGHEAGKHGLAWRERIPADEPALLERAGKVIAELQKSRSKRFGHGRALHRKPLMALSGTLDIPADLPAEARHGLFASPGRHRVLARLSNGGADVQSDRLPDIRGFALKVLDVSGEGALAGDTDHQDFLLINQDRAPSPSLREFVDLMEAMTRGPGPGLLHFFTRYGLSGGWTRLRLLFSILNRKFSGFATELLDTVVPHAVGPYAARVRLAPAGNPAPRERGSDLVGDLRQRLARGPLAWDLQLQFFVDEETTPIENAARPWPPAERPIITVGRLVLDRELPAAELEGAKFDPWSGLAAHRPLGEVMRARKVAYHASQQGRGLA